MFLQCFVDAMAFSSRHKLKFTPDDRVLEVYRSIYRGKTPCADSLECESFLESIQSAFGCTVSTTLGAWHEDVTLRELFSLAVAQQRAPGDSQEPRT